jgi:hypothetical protein
MTARRWEARRSALALIGALLSAIAVGPACSSSSASAASDKAEPLGTFTLAGPTLGAHTLSPRRCASGERQYFLGFDLADEREGVVARLVVDPATGPVVRVFNAAAPFDSTVVFHRGDCRVFHFSVDSTGWRINRIDQLNVSLEVDCELPSGDRIAGKAQDSGCL